MTKHDPILGAVLDERYEVLALIGKGATSVVYQATDLRLKHHVAIKMLHNYLVPDETIVARFEQEARTDSLVVHPNCVTIHDCNTAPSGQPYFVMDYVDGLSLQQMIAATDSLPLEQAINIFTQVCAALAAAHEKGIVHRDLKPGNIMVTKNARDEDFVKVLDFGAAKLIPVQGETYFKMTQTAETIGSILYMSPEQCLDQDVDARSDIYSLGCVLYETLTGKPPFCARTAFETMNKHMTETPERLSRVRPDLELPLALEKVIFKALAKQAQNRYQTAVELQGELCGLQKSSALITQSDGELRQIVQGGNRIAKASEKELKRRITEHNMCGIGIAAMVVFSLATVSSFWGVERSSSHLAMATLISILTLTCCGLTAIWIRYKAKLRRFRQVALLVSSDKAKKMLITHIEQISGEFSQYGLELASAESPNAQPKRVRISCGHPISLAPTTTQMSAIQSGEFWKGLCTADQLEGLSHSGVFPLPCQVYLDPDSQEPVAIRVKDFLAFTVI